MDEENVKYQVSLYILGKLGITFREFLNSTQRRQLIIEKLNLKLAQEHNAPLPLDASDNLILVIAANILDNNAVFELNVLLQCPNDCVTFCQNYKTESSTKESQKKIHHGHYNYFGNQQVLSDLENQAHQLDQDIKSKIIKFSLKINPTTDDYEKLLSEIQRKTAHKISTFHLDWLTYIMINYMQHLTAETLKPECRVDAHSYRQLQLKDQIICINPAEKNTAILQYDDFILTQLEKYAQSSNIPTNTTAWTMIRLSHLLHDRKNSHYGRSLVTDYINKYKIRQQEVLQVTFNNNKHQIQERQPHLDAKARELCYLTLTQQMQHHFIQSFEAEYNVERAQIEKPFTDKIKQAKAAAETWETLSFIPLVATWQKNSKAERIEMLQHELHQALLNANVLSLRGYVKSIKVQQNDTPSTSAVEELFKQFSLGLTSGPLSRHSQNYRRDCQSIADQLMQLEISFKADCGEVSNNVSAMQDALSNQDPQPKTKTHRHSKEAESAQPLIF